jgi:hypothetical protein
VANATAQTSTATDSLVGEDPVVLPQPVRSPTDTAETGHLEPKATQTATSEEPDSDKVYLASLDEPNIARARSELKTAVEKFRKHYEEFSKDNERLVRIENDIHTAIESAATDEDINRSAQLFGAQISTTIEVRNKIREQSNSKWTGQLSTFLTRFYPIARFSLRLTGALSGVIISPLRSVLT